MEAHHHVRNRLVVGLAALLWGLAAAAGEGSPVGAPAGFVKPQLLADVATIAPGEPFHAGVLFKMAEGWHIYWKNPGDAGLATAVEWQLPKGFSAGPLRWPQPKTFIQPGDIVGYGYEKDVLLEATITPPKDLSPGEAVAISAKASWLGCEKLCVPGKEDLALDLTVKGTADTASTPANRDLFATWEAQMPPPAPDFALPDQGGAKVSLSDYKGRVVVLEWFNPDCPFVQRHHAQRTTMIDLAAKYAPKGVVWLAVNSTYYMTPETTAEAHKKWKMDYPVLIDRQGKVGRSYGAKATPDMFVIDRDGQIVYQGAIDNDPPGELKSPVNYVDKALAELLGGKPVSEPKTTPYGCSVKYAPPSVYDFSMDDIEGRPVDLAQFRGKVLLIVNVASQCGFTPQYAGLQKLYEDYGDRGLVVLGFPANNFGGQEPGTNDQIKAFCSMTYHVSFPMFAKSSVAGNDQSPLYRFLTDKATDPQFGGEVAWNFTKFLVGRDGQVVARFDSRAEPTSEPLAAAIQKALSQLAS